MPWLPCLSQADIFSCATALGEPGRDAEGRADSPCAVLATCSEWVSLPACGLWLNRPAAGAVLALRAVGTEQD